jgi:hypothetical protein
MAAVSFNTAGVLLVPNVTKEPVDFIMPRGYAKVMSNDTYTITLTEDQLQALELVLMEAERQSKELPAYPVELSEEDKEARASWTNLIADVRVLLYIQTRKYRSEMA